MELSNNRIVAAARQDNGVDHSISATSERRYMSSFRVVEKGVVKSAERVQSFESIQNYLSLYAMIHSFKVRGVREEL